MKKMYGMQLTIRQTIFLLVICFQWFLLKSIPIMPKVLVCLPICDSKKWHNGNTHSTLRLMKTLAERTTKPLSNNVPNSF